MDIFKRINLSMLSAALILAASNTWSAQYDDNEFRRLLSEADDRGHVRVAVTLEHFSLQEIGDTPEDVRNHVEVLGQSLLNELGDNALRGAYWNNGIGQMAVAVNAEGLRLLAASDIALDFSRDATVDLRIKAADLDGSVEAVEELFLANDYVDVEIFLNSDAVEYGLASNGQTIFSELPDYAAELSEILDRLQTSESQDSVEILGEVAGKPAVVARINKNAFYRLIESDDVRAVRPTQYDDPREAQWPAEALDAATKYGDVSVTISLRGGEFFTPKTGYMSADGIEIQAAANQRAFEEIFASAGLAPVHYNENLDYLLGFVSTRLTYDELSSLYDNADERILSIHLNKGGELTLQTSTAMLNMGPTWAAGYTAAGQSILVLDSGVRKDHVFFSPSPPTTKVTFEACFSTNGTDPVTGITFTSICPSQNGLGDSPLNLAGSGAPYSNATTCSSLGAACSHGTHVAGIAAANTASATTPAWRGVALDANVIAVQLMSVRDTPAAYTIFEDDVVQALTVLHNNTVVGSPNPFTVNMSLALYSTAYSVDCDSHSAAMTAAIHNLVSRGVPVVAATGNNSLKQYIRFPACVSQAIKVSGVENDGVGNTIYADGNYGLPANYTGAFLLAPSGGGSTFVTSAIATGAFNIQGFQGTSQAAPHAAGFYAAIKAASPSVTVAGASAWIISTGSVPVALNLGAPLGTQTFRRLEMPF